MSTTDVLSIIKEVMPYVATLGVPVVAYYVKKLEGHTKDIKHHIAQVVESKEEKGD